MELSGMESAEDEPIIPRVRKRGVTNPCDYKNARIKKARVEGRAYINWKGDAVPERTQGDDCRCRKKCFERIDAQQRAQIFNNFRRFTTKTEQDCYLQSLMSTHPIARKRRRKPAEESSKPDRTTFKFQISSQRGKADVCRKAFVGLHGITDDRVRRLTSLLREGNIPTDKRGKNTPGNAKSGLVMNEVMEHIRSFPVKIAHYTSRMYKYLNERLNIFIMFTLFKSKKPELGVKYSYYKKMFRQQFSLSFGRPQVDTCCTCEELNVKISSRFLNENAKLVAAAEKSVHIKRSKKFTAKMKSVAVMCKNNEKVGGIVIDYMQNVQLPVVPVQETFYLRQITVNVLCIHNLKDDKATFYLYHEGNGTKGPNEVNTFLLDYLTKNPSFKEVEHLHFFADACAAQNRNHTLIRFFSALVSLKQFKKIEQFYPVRGHSFLPCDRDFALLKRKIKSTDRIFTLKEYTELIILSSKNIERFTVVLPEAKDILNFKNWWPTYYKKTMLSLESLGRNVRREDKVSLKISNFRHFIHQAGHDGVILAKEFIDGLVTHTFKLKNSNRDAIVLPVNPAYPEGKVAINIKKLQDVRQLQKFLPHRQDVKEFYDHLLNWPTTSVDLDERVLIGD